MIENLRELVALGRIHFVFGGLLLYCFGYLLALSAGIPFSVDRFLWGYSIIFFAHLSVAYSNDFFDMVEDRISNPTLFSGGSGVLVKHPELAKIARTVALSLIAISFVTAAGFIYYYRFSLLLLLYVLIGVVCAWYYSAPPLRFSHKLYGNIIFSLSICILIPGFGNYIASGTITSNMWALTIPLFFYGSAFSIGVQIPDIEADRINEKRNFASKFGEEASYQAIAILCILSIIAISGIPHIFPFQLDLQPMLIFSSFPLAASLFALAAKVQKNEKKAMAVISSIFLFVALSDSQMAFSYLH